MNTAEIYINNLPHGLVMDLKEIMIELEEPLNIIADLDDVEALHKKGYLQNFVRHTLTEDYDVTVRYIEILDKLEQVFIELQNEVHLETKAWVSNIKQAEGDYYGHMVAIDKVIEGRKYDVISMYERNDVTYVVVEDEEGINFVAELGELDMTCKCHTEVEMVDEEVVEKFSQLIGQAFETLNKGEIEGIIANLMKENVN